MSGIEQKNTQLSSQAICFEEYEHYQLVKLAINYIFSTSISHWLSEVELAYQKVHSAVSLPPFSKEVVLLVLSAHHQMQEVPIHASKIFLRTWAL